MPIEAQLAPEEQAALASLTTPRKIQDFLDSVAYEPEYFNRSPLRVLRERRGHCLDGALFGAAALRRLGYPPLVLDLVPEPLMDDDHVLAVFRQGEAFGVVAKSNFTGLRYREPVYRTLRELVMSYFENYFNSLGCKTLARLHASARSLQIRLAGLGDARCGVRSHRKAPAGHAPHPHPDPRDDPQSHPCGFPRPGSRSPRRGRGRTLQTRHRVTANRI